MSGSRRSAMLTTLLLTFLVGPALCPTLADESPRTLRLVTHNVFYGFTKRAEPRYSEWKRWMAAQAPDVVSLQELNGYTPEKLSADAAAWAIPTPYCSSLTVFPPASHRGIPLPV